MGTLVWDRPGKRVYEAGIDRGVLYTNDGVAVPWNGLTSYSRAQGAEAEAVYYDGVKIHEHYTRGPYTGTLSAIYYPEEFEECQGQTEINCGASLGGQALKRFGLSYRTRIGNDIDGLSQYKLHVVYNLIAVPDASEYGSLSDTPAVSTFQWGVTSVPEEVPGYRPTSELTIDSRKVDPLLLEEIENRLYGTNTTDPYLPAMSELVDLIDGWYRLNLVINDNDTWTATERVSGSHISLDGDYYTIDSPTIVSLDADRFNISDLGCYGPESLLIEIELLGEDRWKAISPYGTITVDEDTGLVSIHNADLSWLTPDKYQISDTKKT